MVPVQLTVKIEIKYIISTKREQKLQKKKYI